MTIRRPCSCQIDDDKLEDYARAADFLNAGQFDVVSLQHEFGIFGGEAGEHILALLSRLTMPVVTTLHTVLAEPTPLQRAVLERIIDASSQRRRHGREGPRAAAHRLSACRPTRSRSFRTAFPTSPSSSRMQAKSGSASPASRSS